MNAGEVGPAEFPEPGREERGGVVGNKKPVRDEDSPRKAVLEQKQFVTGRISETVRYIGFGLLAIFYVIVSSDSVFARGVVGGMNAELRAMAVCGVLALVLDYLQYIFGGIAVERALAGQGESANRYNKNWLVYRARGWCYWAKQVLTLGGCAFLIWILVRSTT